MEECIVEAGYSPNEAKVICWMLNHKETTYIDIERKLRVPEPVVSASFKTMEDNGWIEKISVKHEGKGRPRMLVKLSKSKETILKEINSDLEKRIKYLQKLYTTLSSEISTPTI